MNTIKILLLLITISVSACGSSKTDTQNSQTNLTYDYTENDCKTGSHSFSSLTELCNGLENIQLNNGCAYDLRKSDFLSRCSGAFTEK